MRLSVASLSAQWAMGVCLLLLWATTPAWSRFVAKRETPNVDLGVNAFTVDPDTVMPSSESASRSEVTTATTTTKIATELELENSLKLEQLQVTTTTESLQPMPGNSSILPKVNFVNEAAQNLSQKRVNSSTESNNAELSKTKTFIDKVVNEAVEQHLDNITTIINEGFPHVEKELTTKLENLQNITATIGLNVETTPKEVQQAVSTLVSNDTIATATATTTTRTTTTAEPRTTELLTHSTERSEGHARSMQFASSTEYGLIVTPMKLHALPRTTATTTEIPHLLAALLHAGVTVTPLASQENAIEEDAAAVAVAHAQNPTKFPNDNSTNAQQLTLPNAVEVWSLAGIQMVPTTTVKTLTTTATTSTLSQIKNSTDLANDIEPQQLQPNPVEQQNEKNILDWQQVELMKKSEENRTESVMSTTLDATEAATQATTLKLDEMSNDAEVETATNSIKIPVDNSTMRITEMQTNKNIALVGHSETTADTRPDLYAMEATSTTEFLAETTKAQPDLSAATKSTTTAATTTTPATTTTVAADVQSIANATAKPVLNDQTELNFNAIETTTTVSAKTITTTTDTTTATPVSLTTAMTELHTTLTTSTTTTATRTPTTTTATPTTTTATPTTTTATPTTTTTTTPTTTTTTTTPGTTTTTAMPSALNATPEPNEMAMKAKASENIETDDKANDVDSDDVINVSGSVSTTEATLQPSERQPIVVSTQTAGEVSTTSTTTTTTSAPTTSRILHANVDEQLVTTSTTTATTLATPTQTEIVQISNEVNLETIGIKNATNAEQSSIVNNLLITKSSEKPNTSAANSEQTLQINNNSSQKITVTTTTTEAATTPTSLLTDAKANSKLNVHETSLETNNIGETALTADIQTTTARTLTTTKVIASEASGAAANALDEGTATTTVTATTATTAAKGEFQFDDNEDEKRQIDNDDEGEQLLTKANMENTTTTTTAAAVATTTESTTTTSTTTTSTTTTTTAAPNTTKLPTTTSTEEPLISLLDDSTTTPITTTTVGPIRTTTSTSTEPIYSSTTNTNNHNMLPAAPTTNSANGNLPTTMEMPHPSDLDHMQQPHGGNTGTDVNVIIAITVSVIGVVALILLVAFLYLMRKRQKQTSYGQRCRPVSLDAYSLDNVSVLGSVRRKGRDLRASKRTYGNAAFDDPSLRHNLVSATELGKFVERRSSIFEEFRDVPQIIARADEVPQGCEDKNRYANVIPLPETRVVLQRQGDDDKTEYINANYVRGPRDAPNYYIACQAPLESTTGDFWRMIWEQQSRVIIQATDLNENGIERCAEYIPPSVTLDNHSSYGDYQVTLKHREVKDKYAISTLMLKHMDGSECRELTHYWYKWPELGVPLEEAPIIAMLLEARSSLKSYALEQANELKEKSSTLTLKSLEPATLEVDTSDAKQSEEAGSTSSGASNEINGNVANSKTARSQQGPLTIHCSPGTGRTGTIITCDMAIRSLETPKRSVDIPQLVYYVRRGRASAVQTKEQYEFIYKVANMYATKITNLSNDN